MPRAVVSIALVALGCFLAASSAARAQPIDRWHYIDADSVLHTRHVEGLQGAGVIQSDQVFALLYLGLPGENGVVSVVLPTPDPAGKLVSILVKSNGTQFRRELTADELDIAPASESDHAYSFIVTDADVALFKSAIRWELAVGDDRWEVTLRGSRNAIQKAEAERARLITALSAGASDDDTSD